VDKVLVSESGQPYQPGGNTKLGSTDAAGKFGVERSSSRVRIVWHYRARTEKRTYTITYRFRGLAVAYDDIVDVNMKVWGAHWPVPLGRLDSRVEFPETATLDGRYNVWGHPRWVHGVVARTPQAATLKAVNIGSHQFVEFRVTVPRSFLTSTKGAKVVEGPGLEQVRREEAEDQAGFERNHEKFEDAKRHIGRTLGYLALMAFGPATALILLTWFLFGRERRTGYDREYEQEPPTETKAAMVPPLLRQQKTPGSLEWTATLFDLIRMGRFVAAPVTTRRSVWGGLRHEDVADLEISLGDASMHLRDFEQAVASVVDDVIDEGSERLTSFRKKIEAHRTTNASRFERFKKDVGEAIGRQKWFAGEGAKLLALAIAASVVLAVLFIWLAADGWRSEAPRWSDAVLAAIGGCAAVNAALLIVAVTRVKLWRRRTKDGQLEAER
jgi:uncharacterized membrane protein